MIDLASYMVFLAACVALIIVPGPAQVLVISNTVSRGPKAGAITAVGLNIGTLFHSATAGLGLSAVLATSALAFAIVKYIGAAYLIYLGIRALMAKPARHETQRKAENSTGSLLGQAALAGILNPKVALFFLAFLPQFVDPHLGAVLLQFLILGASMALLDVLYELLMVHFVGKAKTHFLSSPRVEKWRKRIIGSVLILLGLRLAVQQR